VKLISDAILDCTVRGDIVLDAFLGSGSTLIAAERVRRRCFGLELDPLYADTIIRRWQTITHGVARHAVTGLAFEGVETMRRHAEPETTAAQDKASAQEILLASSSLQGGL
jgi:tRNA G10  N-methylase Trm11